MGGTVTQEDLERMDQAYRELNADRAARLQADAERKIEAMMQPKLVLPTTDAERKAIPVWDGCVMYFPKALLAIAAVSKAGNDQHNPGEPLHWARGKSMDQMNTAMRHMMDHGVGTVLDTDGQRHLAKAAWRILAALELSIEGEGR